MYELYGNKLSEQYRLVDGSGHLAALARAYYIGEDIGEGEVSKWSQSHADAEGEKLLLKAISEADINTLRALFQDIVQECQLEDVLEEALGSSLIDLVNSVGIDKIAPLLYDFTSQVLEITTAKRFEEKALNNDITRLGEQFIRQTECPLLEVYDADADVLLSLVPDAESFKKWSALSDKQKSKLFYDAMRKLFEAGLIILDPECLKIFNPDFNATKEEGDVEEDNQQSTCPDLHSLENHNDANRWVEKALSKQANCTYFSKEGNCRELQIENNGFKFKVVITPHQIKIEAENTWFGQKNSPEKLQGFVTITMGMLTSLAKSSGDEKIMLGLELYTKIPEEEYVKVFRTFANVLRHQDEINLDMQQSCEEAKKGYKLFLKERNNDSKSDQYNINQRPASENEHVSEEGVQVSHRNSGVGDCVESPKGMELPQQGDVRDGSGIMLFQEGEGKIGKAFTDEVRAEFDGRC